MHPLLEQRVRLSFYLLAWIMPLALIVFLLATLGSLRWMEAIGLSLPLCIFYAFVCLTPWYLCRSLPLNTAQPARLVGHHGGVAVIAASLWILIAIGFAYALSEITPPLNGASFQSRVRAQAPLLFGVGVLLYTIAVIAHYAWIAVEDSRQAALFAREAELRALKAQINPHFLFNSLNSISALTTVDPSRARDMCLRLSDFLRSTLGLGTKESIPWNDELALARTYLEVEQVRFGRRLAVEYDVAPECEGCHVPPLVLQPLVENAVKHGIATMIDGGVIRLQARAGNDLLRIVIENDFDPEAPVPRRSGLGLRNVRDRLEARYGKDASIESRSQNNRFRVELLLPSQIVEASRAEGKRVKA
ncbi:MAG: histidine kinase [Bryobacteraceae bacterium]